MNSITFETEPETPSQWKLEWIKKQDWVKLQSDDSYLSSIACAMLNAAIESDLRVYKFAKDEARASVCLKHTNTHHNLK